MTTVAPVGWHEIAGLTPLMFLIVAIGVFPRPFLSQIRPAVARIDQNVQAQRGERDRSRPRSRSTDQPTRAARRRRPRASGRTKVHGQVRATTRRPAARRAPGGSRENPQPEAGSSVAGSRIDKRSGHESLESLSATSSRPRLILVPEFILLVDRHGDHDGVGLHQPAAALLVRDQCRRRWSRRSWPS